jgi:hypothetical protein
MAQDGDVRTARCKTPRRPRFHSMLSVEAISHRNEKGILSTGFLH